MGPFPSMQKVMGDESDLESHSLEVLSPPASDPRRGVLGWKESTLLVISKLQEAKGVDFSQPEVMGEMEQSASVGAALVRAGGAAAVTEGSLGFPSDRAAFGLRLNQDTGGGRSPASSSSEGSLGANRSFMSFQLAF